MRPEITLPDQQIGPGTGNLKLQAKRLLHFQKSTNATQAEIEAHPRLNPVEEPNSFDSSPLNQFKNSMKIQNHFAKIAEAKRNEGKSHLSRQDG